MATGAEKPSKFAQLRARYEWLDHLVRAGARYTESHGDHYAAAITYFSVLALVPLLMIGFAAAGFVLAAHPDLIVQLRASITGAMPGGLGDTVNDIVDKSIASAGAVGAFGLLGALYSGIGWMSNLREALSEQWGQRSEPPNMIKRTFFDLLALLGLGVALVVSVAVAAIGGRPAAYVLDLLGWGGSAWAVALLKLLTWVVGLIAGWLVFLWTIARLPREPVTLRSAAKAAVFGAIGFEVLKKVMVFYLGTLRNSPAGAAFGSIIGLLVFVFLASRFLLFATAWAATTQENERLMQQPPPPPVTISPGVVVRSGPDARTAAGLLGLGAFTGLLAGAVARRRGRDMS